MAGTIEAADLVEAVRGFLAEIEGDLKGRRAFHAKVASNALAIVVRELRERPLEAEAAAFGTLGSDPVEACRRIRAGEWTSATPGLLDALESGIIARLAVDNPRFSTLPRLREKRA